MNFEDVLDTLRHEKELIVQYEGQSIDQFRWEPKSSQYYVPFDDNGRRLPNSELDQIYHKSREVFRRNILRQLRRLKKENIDVAQWQQNMEKLCAEYFKLQFFVDNGGLDPKFEHKVKEQLDGARFLPEAGWRAAIAKEEIEALGDEIASGRLGPYLEFGQLETRTLALFPDAVERADERNLYERERNYDRFIEKRIDQSRD